MESEKEIVTLSDIKRDLLKQEIVGMIVFVIFSPFFYCMFTLLSSLSNAPLSTIFTIFTIIFALLGPTVIILCIYNIIKIHKNTYFKVRTAILVDKKEYTWDWRQNSYVDRLVFQKSHYNISLKNNDVLIDIYNSDMKTVFDTSFIDDSFTLIEVRNNIVYAFNNKFFDIQDDL